MFDSWLFWIVSVAIWVAVAFWPARVALAYAPLPRWITDPAYRGMFAPPGGIARADPGTQGQAYRSALSGGTGEPLAGGGGGGGGFGGGRLADDDDDDDFADYDDSDLAYEGFDADDLVYSMTVSSAA